MFFCIFASLYNLGFMFTLPISEKTIDIAQVIKSKSEKLYRYLPGFVISYLRRILHEKELNSYLYKNKEAMGIDFATAILNDFGCAINVEGLENIPLSQNFVLVANHPLGGLDGMAIISKIGAVRKDLLFPVNSFLMFLPNLRPIFIPIDKFGKNINNQELLKKIFSSSSPLLYFPAGLCSRKQKDGKIKDLEWKKTFITKAKENNRQIIPVFIEGKNSNFFYNFARFRIKMGIKINLEQFYLVDEMFKQKGKTVKITVGKPIDPQLLDNSCSDKEWASKIKDFVYSLEQNTKAVFSA